VRRATGSAAPANASAGTGVALPTWTATSVTNAGLASNTTYSYAVFSYAVFTKDVTGNVQSSGVIRSQWAVAPMALLFRPTDHTSTLSTTAETPCPFCPEAAARHMDERQGPART